MGGSYLAAGHGKLYSTSLAMYTTCMFASHFTTSHLGYIQLITENSSISF